nr:MobV family relaxase [Marortus sp. BJYM1]
MRTKKLKTMGAVGGAGGHNSRTRETPNADPEKLHLNRRLVGTDQPLVAQVKNHIKQADAKLNKNSPPAFEVLLTASPESMKNITDKKDLGKWVSANIDWLKKNYGNNLITVDLHRDEKTPHLHAIVCPVVARFDKRANKEINRVTCKEYLDGRGKLSALQDSYAQAMKPFALDRGVKKSKATHTEVREWYAIQQRVAVSAKKTIKVPAKPEPIKPKIFETPSAFGKRMRESFFTQLAPDLDLLVKTARDQQRVLLDTQRQLEIERQRVSDEVHYDRERNLSLLGTVYDKLKQTEQTATQQSEKIKAQETELHAVSWKLSATEEENQKLRKNLAPRQSPSGPSR